MTTAEIEDLMDTPQTCHPSSCAECWKSFTNKKRCQTPGSDLWPARREQQDANMAAHTQARIAIRLTRTRSAKEINA